MDERAIERVFRSLVRGPSVTLAVRDPKTVGEIAAITGLDPDTVARVVGEFSAEDNLFLRVDQPITPDSFVDLNHESLIRQWRTLSDWVGKEAEAAETWQGLARATAEWKRAGEPDADLPGGPGLGRRLAWWNAEEPNAAWAARYTSPEVATVADVGRYLEAAQAREETVRSEEARRGQRMRVIMGAVGALLLLVGFVSTLWFQQSNAAARLTQVNNDLKAASDEQEVLIGKLNTSQGELTNALASANTQRRRAEENSLEAKRQTKLAEESKRREVRAQQLATQRVAEAGDRAKIELLGAFFRDMTVQQHSVDASMPDFVQRYGQFRDLVTGVERAMPEKRALLARLETQLAGTEARALGRGERPAEAVAESMRAHAGEARSLSSDPETRARSLMVEGHSHEIMADYPHAIESYRQVLAGAPPEPIALQASTRLAALSRQAGDLDRAEAYLEGRCDEPSTTAVFSSDAEMSVSYLECRKVAADIAIDRGDHQSARAILADIGVMLGDDKFPSAPGLSLRLRTEIARVDAGDPPSTDEDRKRFTKVFEEAKFFNSRQLTEESSSLYADALLAAKRPREALDVRAPFLAVGHTSLSYLAGSEPLIFTMASETGHRADPWASRREEAGADSGSSDHRIEVIHERLARIFPLAAMASALNRLRERNVPLAPKVPDRSDLIADVARRMEVNLGAINAELEGLADSDGLLDDLKRSRLAVVTAADVAIGDGVADLLSRYRTACDLVPDDFDGPEVVAMIGACKANLAEAERTLDPVVSLTPSEDLGKYWFEGRDPTSYGTDRRAQRGQTDLAVEHEGRTALFASRENLEAFRRNPESYLPQFGGNAPAWIEIGELRPGDSDIFCMVQGRRMLLEREAEKAEWCADGEESETLRLRMAAVDAQWAKLKRDPDAAKVRFEPPMQGIASSDNGPYRIYSAPAGTEVRAPAGGRFRQSGYFSRIEHADGSRSELTGLRTPPPSDRRPEGRMVRRGEPIGHLREVGPGRMAELRFSVLRKGEEGYLRRVKIGTLLPE